MFLIVSWQNVQVTGMKELGEAYISYEMPNITENIMYDMHVE